MTNRGRILSNVQSQKAEMVYFVFKPVITEIKIVLVNIDTEDLICNGIVYMLQSIASRYAHKQADIRLDHRQIFLCQSIQQGQLPHSIMQHVPLIILEGNFEPGVDVI